MVRRISLCFGGALLLAGLGLLGDTVYLELKAALAEVLIDRAFAAHLETGRPQRPWEWADTDPIARLDLPRLAVRQHVLRGASGGSMAFGLGHVDGTAPPNAPGNCVLVGHRDTWFSFLREVQIGDELVLRTASGRVRYRVDSMEVIEADDRSVLEPSAENRLTLVTCYPLSGLAASDHRYVVRCTPVAEATHGA